MILHFYDRNLNASRTAVGRALNVNGFIYAAAQHKNRLAS